MKANVQPLSTVRADSTVQMVSVNCGRGLCARLASMGLRPGTCFKVLKSSPPGPLMIAVGHSRLGLGRGIAQRIMVSTDNDTTS